MTGAKKLVMGASGFLGSHVTRQLVERGDDVRVILRRTSSTKAIDDLDVEYHYGDIFDDAAVRTAMADCDDVFYCYCVVDTRAWLRDPSPLFRTNVEGLRHVLDAAVDADLRRFVFTSSIGTIGIPTERRPATEEDAFNWPDKGGDYVLSRVESENLVIRYAKERGLPAVVLCVSNTYGPRDWQPPHGKQLAIAAAGKWRSTSRVGQVRWWASRTRLPPCFSQRRRAETASATVGDVCDGLRRRRRAQHVSPGLSADE